MQRSTFAVTKGRPPAPCKLHGLPGPGRLVVLSSLLPEDTPLAKSGRPQSYFLFAWGFCRQTRMKRELRIRLSRRPRTGRSPPGWSSSRSPLLRGMRRAAPAASQHRGALVELGISLCHDRKRKERTAPREGHGAAVRPRGCILCCLSCPCVLCGILNYVPVLIG